MCSPHGLGGKSSYTSSLRDGRLDYDVYNGRSEQSYCWRRDIRCSVSLLDDAIPEPVTAGTEIAPSRIRNEGPSASAADRLLRQHQMKDDEEEKAQRNERCRQASGSPSDGRRSIGETATESDVWPDEFTDQDGGKVDDLGEVKSVLSSIMIMPTFAAFLDAERDDNQQEGRITEQYRIGMLVSDDGS